MDMRAEVGAADQSSSGNMIVSTGSLWSPGPQITDGAVRLVDRSLARKEWPHPRWLSWTIVITAGIVVRQFLVWIIISM